MADTKKKAEPAAPETTAVTFTREALANSKKYRPWCDVLMIVLEEGKQYTMAEADAALEKFKGKKIIEKVNGKDDE